MAKILWHSVHIAFNINPPNSIHTLFGTWLNGVETELAKHIRVGVCALLRGVNSKKPPHWASFAENNEVDNHLQKIPHIQ